MLKIPQPSPVSAPDDGVPAHVGAILTIDLGAIEENYRRLRARFNGATCGAVLKANAYGLGADHVAPVLAAAGCRNFFVAHVAEGVALRPHVPAEADIFVMHGAMPGAEDDCVEHRLIPTLNGLEQIEAWRALASRRGRKLRAVLQVDTGMSRLGLSTTELDTVAADHDLLAGIDLHAIMSHLACAEAQEHPANAFQLANFRAALARLPAAKASLANSSGVFLDKSFHFDIARPGAALYGIAPIAGAPNPMRPVVHLQARVMQQRDLGEDVGIGYGWSYRTSTATRTATLAVGYADGFMRSLGNHGRVHVGEIALPIVGKVSMDTLIVDATALPPDALPPGTLVDLIGPHQSVDEVAAAAGTIGYELLTTLGQRYARRYIA